MRKIATVLALILTVGLAGCGQKAAAPQPSPYRYSPTPEAAIYGFVQAANAGEYETATAFYHGAPDLWKRDPGAWKRVIEVPTRGQKILRFEPLIVDTKADTATITGWIHKEEGSQREVRFDLVKQSQGWLIARFV